MKDTKYIFIVGSSRSGTTMMSRVLNENKSIFSFQELHFFSQFYSNRKSDRLDYKLSLKMLLVLFNRQEYGVFTNNTDKKFNTIASSLISDNSDYSYFEIFGIFIDYILKNKGKNIACLQTPNNLFYIKDILEEYPNSVAINMVRDNRDVLLSQKHKWRRKFLGAQGIPLFESFRSMFNYHPITTSLVWNSSLSVTERFINNQRFKVIRFEDFISLPIENCKDICSFLSVDFHDKMLLVPNIGSSTKKDENNLLIDSTKIYKWKNGGLNKAELFLAQYLSRYFMQKYQYEKMNFIFHPLSLLFYFITFPIKSFFAFCFNLGRISSVVDIIKPNKKE